MADTITANLGLDQPEVGASDDTWGGKQNDAFGIIDGLFNPDGSGTSVGLNVGVGKVLALGGTLRAAATAVLDFTLAAITAATSHFRLVDATDPTKTLHFDISAFTTLTDHVVAFPDASDTVALVGLAQTLDAKTLHNSELTGTTKAPTPALTAPGTSVATLDAVNAAIAAAIAAIPPGATQYWQTGMIAMCGAAAPAGFLLCDGSNQLIATYPALAAYLGVTYGPGDGTHFALPDFRGRAAHGPDSGAGRLGGGLAGGITGPAVPGAAGGSQNHTLTPAQGPNMPVSVGSLVTTAGGSNVNSNFYDIGCIDGTNYGQAVLTGGTTGGGSAHNNLPPALVVNFIIKT